MLKSRILNASHRYAAAEQTSEVEGVEPLSSWSLDDLTDWLAHTPRSVLAKNFNLAPEIFDHIPASEKYIFQGSKVGPIDDEAPHGVKKSKLNFAHKMLAQEPVKTSGGEVRITDSRM